MDDCIPLHFGAGGTFGDPMRTRVIDDGHRLQVFHESRQVLEVPPEAIDVEHGAVDGDTLLHLDALSAPYAGDWAGAIVCGSLAGAPACPSCPSLQSFGDQTGCDGKEKWPQPPRSECE